MSPGLGGKMKPWLGGGFGVATLVVAQLFGQGVVEVVVLVLVVLVVVVVIIVIIVVRDVVVIGDVIVVIVVIRDVVVIVVGTFAVIVIVGPVTVAVVCRDLGELLFLLAERGLDPLFALDLRVGLDLGRRHRLLGGAAGASATVRASGRLALAPALAATALGEVAKQLARQRGGLAGHAGARAAQRLLGLGGVRQRRGEQRGT